MPLPRFTCQRPATTLNAMTGWSLFHTTVRRPFDVESEIFSPTEFAVKSAGVVMRIRVVVGSSLPNAGSVIPS